MRLLSIWCSLWLIGAFASTAAGQFAEWQHQGTVYVLTTPDGADVPDAVIVENFPLLVRLQRDLFDFRQARSDGADLRFTTSEGTPLAYQIEEWDPVRGEACIWVRVPRIAGNARQALRVFWGHPTAPSESNGAAVFRAEDGYLSVWHLGETIRDEVGTLTMKEVGTTVVPGRIGSARHYEPGQGVFGGDKIENYPSGGAPHSTEAWFRPERSNATLIGWGNEGGGLGTKMQLQLRSPPHLHVDSFFADVDAPQRLTMGEWVHVVHTYENRVSRLYVNGELAAETKPTLAIKTPSRLWLGGWYHQYNYLGDLDEVRVSKIARTPEWIRLQYANQRAHSPLVGPIVPQGTAFGLSAQQLTVAEGETAAITAQAGGAQKLTWVLKRNGREQIVATDRLSYEFPAGRVKGDESATLEFRALFPDGWKTTTAAITIREAIPEPIFTLQAPAQWDGRQTIEVVPQITNRAAMVAAGRAELNMQWTVDGLATIRRVDAEKLVLTRAQNSGTMTVTATIDNGGARVVQSLQVAVTEPPPSADPWVPRALEEFEQPADGQFYARERHDRDGPRTGTLHYRGQLEQAAESVFVRVYADDRLFQTVTGPVTADKRYALAVNLNAGLIKYRTEFGTRTGDRETVLHRATDLVCGDVYLIIGQSNAVATDFGKENPLVPNEWVRTFGATDGSPNGARLKQWAYAQARSPGGKGEIGYWGMVLGQRLVESQKLPICIINGAVGGTRIDQHQRNPVDPTDVRTIYGRLLWRVREAKVAHGVRAILWHQGENDQGADGPSGGFGYETYRTLFIDLAAAWKEDYPNVDHYGVFQIWPKSCAMGIDGSDNRLREVQRSLAREFSNLTVMATLGVKPPGGCHFPAAGYAEFARMIAPVLEKRIYFRHQTGVVESPNLITARFANDRRDELILKFDSPVVWREALANQFFLDGVRDQIASGSTNGQELILKLKEPTTARKLTYLDSASWSPDNLLMGKNDLAALTFCDVPLTEPK